MRRIPAAGRQHPSFACSCTASSTKSWKSSPSIPNYAPRLLNESATEAPSELSKSCIVASGVVLAYAREILVDLGLWDKIPVYQVPMPYPLAPSFRDDLLARYERILVLEESYPVIELQFQNRSQVLGRTTGTVPSSGELLPEVVEDYSARFPATSRSISRCASRLSRQAPHPLRRLPSSGHLLCHEEGFSQRDLSQRHRLLHARP